MSNYTDQLSAAGVVCWTREEYESKLRAWGCMPKGLIYQIEGTPGYFVGSGSSNTADNCIPTKDMLGMAIPEGGTPGQYLTPVFVDGELTGLEWSDLPAPPDATADTPGLITLTQVQAENCKSLIAKGVDLNANCVTTLTNYGIELHLDGAGAVLGLYVDGEPVVPPPDYQVTCIGSGDIWVFDGANWAIYVAPTSNNCFIVPSDNATTNGSGGFGGGGGTQMTVNADGIVGYSFTPDAGGPGIPASFSFNVSSGDVVEAVRTNGTGTPSSTGGFVSLIVNGVVWVVEGSLTADGTAALVTVPVFTGSIQGVVPATIARTDDEDDADRMDATFYEKVNL